MSSLWSSAKKYLISLSLALLICEYTSFAKAADLSVPSFGSARSGFQRELVSQERDQCKAIFSPHHEEVRSVIKAANDHFKRRGWSDEFLVERFKVAEKYDSQSEYYVIRKIDSQEIVATIGITIAEYTKKNIKQMIPVEETLKVFPLARPLDSKGHGFIAELRTYSIERSFHFDAYPELLSFFFENFYSRLQDYPELYDQPILYTYADETSLKMYGMMGFRKLSEEPTVHEGSNWWVMATSPKVLERVSKRVLSPKLLQGFNQPMDVKLQNGVPAILETQGLLLNQDYLRSQNSGLSQFLSEVHAPVEVEAGIWADRGSSLAWYDNGRLALVTKLAKPLELPGGLTASVGTKVVFGKEGQVTEIEDLAIAAVVAPGIKASAHSRVEWYTDGRLHSVSKLARKAKVAHKIFAAKDAHVVWGLPNAQLSYVSKLAKNTDLGADIFAAKGAEVSWVVDWSRKRIVLSSISKILNECEIAPNIWAATGASFHFNHDPKKTPAVSILARPVRIRDEILRPGAFMSYGLDQEP